MSKDREKNNVDYFPSWGAEELNTLSNQARDKKIISNGAPQDVLGNNLNVSTVLHELDIILDERL